MRRSRKIEPDPLFLAAALREPQRLASLTSTELEAFADAAARQGVCGVLLHRAHAEGIALPTEHLLRSAAAQEAAAAALRDREAIRTLACLERAGIGSVVLKGLGLAYTVYPEPWMRPRSDTDLLVSEEEVPAVEEVFRQEGYTRLPHVRGDLTLPQVHYYSTDARSGFRHNWDIHWRLTSSHVLAGAPADLEVWEHRRSVSALGGAHVPAPPHALMIACVHRLAHHYDDPRLIWLWDIRLLLETMSAGDLSVFAALAGRSRASASACGRSLAAARERCGAAMPAVLSPLLDAASDRSPAAFLWSGSRRRVSYLAGELRAMPRATRLRALRQHLLPSLASMRERYPAAPAALLPLLYPWRLVRGVPKWLSGRD